MTEELIVLDDGYKPKLMWTEFKKNQAISFLFQKIFKLFKH